jgi:RNA polymerase sigma-70 factor (ECF subfamily)
VGFHPREKFLSEAISSAEARMQIQSDLSDVDLVKAADRGQRGAVRKLFQRFSSMAYSLALRVAGNEADAEEVLMDSFFQVWKQAGRYNPSRGTVAGWILNIVRSRGIDRVRSRLRVVRTEKELQEEDAFPMASRPPSPEKQAIHSEEKAVVKDALGTLPEDQRLVIELAYFSGLSQSEIATQLGQPLGTVKTRMRLAMQKLRRTLVQE